ncbi:hypothetical protein AMTR_s00020p00208190 [Amborella trichopoda]|uniref:Uncharacterized protein n=1 Tax=Amborella trichopoda TaxID=13333 RepID=W1PV04_AMBTC|nr:hypothetical protein AMTR_s00020p00208190 [Amborella trichopoda]
MSQSFDDPDIISLGLKSFYQRGLHLLAQFYDAWPSRLMSWGPKGFWGIRWDKEKKEGVMGWGKAPEEVVKRLKI